MPYIRGRYYMNPVVGDALEAAREAEAALQALEHPAKVARGDTGEGDDAGASSSSGGTGGSNAASSGANSNADAYAKSAPGPIHRVEIEAAELVPSHSGRAQRGFVARIHRHANGNAANAPAQDSLPGRFVKFAVVNRERKRRTHPPRYSRATPRCQTHRAKARCTPPPKPTSSPITTT